MTALRFIALLFALVGIGWLIWWDSKNPDVSFLASFLAAQVPSALAMLFIAYRTRFLSDFFVPMAIAVRGNALALFGNLILPARLGDLGKPFYLNTLCSFPVSKGLVLVVEERIWDFVGLGILALLTLFLIGEHTDSAALATASYVTIAIAVCGLACLIVLPRITRHLPVLSRLDEKYALFSGKTPLNHLKSLAITMLIWTASLAMLAVAYQFSGLPALQPEQLLLLFVMSTLGLVISVTPGSIGTFEGAIVAVLVGFDIKWDAALAFAIGFRLTWLALPVMFAIIAVLSDTRLLSMLQKSDRG